MATLFSYCIRHDTGAAPNPFWGVCTLVICKPKIRSAARVGDWVVGTGSRSSPAGDASGRLVFAMRVSQQLTMAEYDTFAQTTCSGKLPDLGHPDPRRHVGDALYDFSTDPPTLRPGVHIEGNRKTDLGGRYALLSDHFLYFGSRPCCLPDGLLPIARQRPGHQSRANTPLRDAFVEWLESLGLEWNQLVGMPQHWSRRSSMVTLGMANRRA
jgi:Nucleotide modification associated domain 2